MTERSGRKGTTKASKGAVVSPAPPRRWSSKLLRAGAVGGLLTTAGGLASLVVCGFLYRQYVIVDPGPHLDPDHVRSIIAQESPVYYRDGTTRIGVFFEDEHRSYVPWDELPQAWVMGIVAAEDGAFWTHWGVSGKHLVRAMRDNVAAGTMVAGGSTLTQQTAKNLYYRPDRSVKSKLQELLNALRLEAHFDKRQILTFYANQFHVAGNGRGLGIGARYFFDKDPSQLEVEEAAFLAGLVKAPSRYDPFLGDAERRARAVEKAHERTRYVLRRMAEEELENLVPPRSDRETEAEYDARVLAAGRIRARARTLLDEGFTLDFTRGTFRYDSNAVLDEVARRLAEPPFDAVLAAAGIDDPATAGLKVITTLDPYAQQSSVYGLWHQLTEVGGWMEAKGGPADWARAFTLDGTVAFDPDRPLHQRDFRRAEVLEVVTTPKKHLRVDLGGPTCIVDRDAVVRAAVAMQRGVKGDRNAKASGAEVDAFTDALAPGSVVWVSVRAVEPVPVCDLERRPELQGALVVLEDGQIRAMVGGNDNRNFNRVSALRQMGSTWKPLIFHAALELGWSPADELDNRRNVFPYSTTFYYPRPDHEPADVVSMSWAGVNSENLASVWLLYHLTDRLDGAQVKALAASLGLARRPDEAEADYRTRIQKLGVLPTQARVDEALFLMSRQELIRDPSALSHPGDALALQSMLYGWGHDAEVGRARSAGGREQEQKLAALAHTWRNVSARLDDCRAQYAVLGAAWDRGELPPDAVVPDLSVMVGETGIQVACGRVPEGYGPASATLEDLLAGELPAPVPDGEPTPPPEAAPEPEPRRLFPWLRSRPEPVGELPPLRPGQARRMELVPFEDVLIEERLHASTVITLADALKRQQLARELGGGGDLYEPEILYWHQDFRVLLSLRYVESLARRYGVSTELQPVLSLPLGASEVTLEEMASVYQGITTGEVWTFPGRAGSTEVASPSAPTLLIAEIRDVDDHVIYRAQPRGEVVARPHSAGMTADILRNVVRHGTGQRALTAVSSGGAAVPLGGKTGTTNDFRNAAFVGFAPRATSSGYDVEAGYSVAAYVGYDDNREMRNGSIKLAGASGALPAWIDAISGMEQAGLLDAPSGLDAEAGAWPLVAPGGLVRVPAAEGTGLVLSGADYDPAAPSVLVPLPTVVEVPRVEFTAPTRPVRLFPRTGEGEPLLQPRDLWGRRRRPAPVGTEPDGG